MDRTGQELAIDRQREDVMRWVTAMGWDVLGEFVDNDVSATSGKRRPDFERMMALVDEGEVDVIVVRHLDRLLRRLVELEDVLMRCEPMTHAIDEFLCEVTLSGKTVLGRST